MLTNDTDFLVLAAERCARQVAAQAIVQRDAVTVRTEVLRLAQETSGQ